MIIFRFFKYLFINIKYSKLLKKIYIEENILNNLSMLFNSNFRIDWIGRIYTVINPNLTNGEYDSNVQIFEYDENGLNNDAYIEKWIMTRLNIASNFIKTNNLFDLLTYNIKRLDEYDNFLLIIQPITLQDCLKYTKYFTILISVIITILIIFTIIL